MAETKKKLLEQECLIFSHPIMAANIADHVPRMGELLRLKGKNLSGQTGPLPTIAEAEL